MEQLNSALQAPSDHYRFTDLLNALNLPAPTRGTVMKVAGNSAPVAVGLITSALNVQKHPIL